MTQTDTSAPQPTRQASESFCPGNGGAAAAQPGAASIALLARHILSDGEIVLLILRPSRWFILLSSIRFLAFTALLAGLAVLFDERIHYAPHRSIEAAIFIMAGRLMWAVLQWMGRLYVLTDLRILRLSGVFNVEIFACQLRRVARTLLDATLAERLCRIGSIVIIPQDEHIPVGVWQMVARPRQIHEKILATIARAKQGERRD